MIVNGRPIGQMQEPYLIAELSANHQGKLEIAKKSVLLAKNSGADAIKLQTYDPDSMTLNIDNEDFIVKSGIWKGCHLHRLYTDARTPFEWHAPLFDYAKQIGVTIFSSPFCEKAIELLERLQCPAYKVASFELTDLDLIRSIANTKKPIFLSTGMSTEGEIADALEVIASRSNAGVLLFHCISAYPAPFESMNLSKLTSLSRQFKVPVGLSDHSMSSEAAKLAIALGASAIEKHFISDKSLSTPDAGFSIDPYEFRDLVQTTKSVWRALGSGEIDCQDIESSGLQFRRSWYFSKRKLAGEFVSESDVVKIRPGLGLKLKSIQEVLGRKLVRDVYRGQRVEFEDFEQSSGNLSN
jgi:N-acetylneuraminate synthase